MQRLSLGWLTLQGCTPPEHIAAAAAAGYQGVSLMIGDAFMPVGVKLDCEPRDLIADTALRRETMKLAKATGIVIDAMEGFLLSPFFNLDTCRAALDASAEMGISQVAGMDMDPDRRRASENLAAWCEMAKERGLGACIEFMSLTQVKTLGNAVDLVKSGKYPGLTVMLDTLHLARSGGTPADVAKVDPALFDCVQFCDGPATAPDDAFYWHEAGIERQIPGDGALPLKAVYDAIPKDIVVYIEVPQHTARE